MSLWMFSTLENREDMTMQRYTKLPQKYWYMDNVLGAKRYKREAKTPFGSKKQIWARDYSEWGVKKDKWMQLERALNETGLTEDELLKIENITIAELSDEWINIISPKRQKEGTVERRQTSYNTYVSNSPLAAAKVRAIDSRYINRFFNTLDDYQAKKRAKDYLNPLFRYAMEKEIISSNPIPPKVLEAISKEEALHKANSQSIQEDIIFEDEEMNYLYEAAKKYGKGIHIPIALMMYGGMRISEALATQVHNTNLKNGTLQVTKQTKAVNKKKHGVSKKLVPPKTANSVRTFPLPNEVVQIILDGRYSGKDEFLFTQGNGDWVVKNNWSNTYMNKFLKKIGLWEKFKAQPNHLLRKYSAICQSTSSSKSNDSSFFIK